MRNGEENLELSEVLSEIKQHAQHPPAHLSHDPDHLYYYPNSVSTLRGSYGSSKGRSLIRWLRFFSCKFPKEIPQSVPLVFAVNSYAKWLL